MTGYKVLASTMAAEIRSGSIKVGARMPSLRQVIAQHGVSQSTVFRACYLIEERGLIRAAWWFMTNFQNPTGVALTVEKKRALVDLIDRHDVPLIEDDVYAELHFQADYPLPARGFDKRGTAMHYSSLSKTLAPGYRIGWVAAGRFADKVQKRKLMTTLSSSIPVQARLADYLHHGGYERHLRKLRSALLAQLASMDAAIRRWMPPGVKWTRPDGGYFVWLEFPEPIDAMELHRLAIEHGIGVAPGPMFSVARTFENCIRLNFGHPWNAKIDDALRVLGEPV
ncbi:aminotransferase class I/II-fold pyridoxal phosphate-dependent enzyme [Paraburkholderia sp. SARCC-3016]|uniref:aminotransferase-like domain-containing protein n=1 Tax=Paraburkholderia sp. SARCC-3016 TaxID=3058611 RepID=UPI00280840D4|nr:aminotransferase class I/II-fold pyridoxal phosphate-dependent enzyme [Paraburkholderia sp. SARCC-3016]MDQ7978361.1 aminotransferase class I/II-fold pyridoxal phosphate-dependent enzyme [Paraburkholderia sp. SARCC-3016]